MRVVCVDQPICVGGFSQSSDWLAINSRLQAEIRAMEYPTGSGQFHIYPESGKKRGMGNGVTPIKTELMTKLSQWQPPYTWNFEVPLNIATARQPGKVDAVLSVGQYAIALEWETGNISSSHRALNKMALGLMSGVLSAGVLVLPTKNFAQYLTDRVGNYEEISPYFDLWRSLNCQSGILEIIAIEHDATSLEVPKIPKGTDGRAIS